MWCLMFWDGPPKGLRCAGWHFHPKELPNHPAQPQPLLPRRPKDARNDPHAVVLRTKEDVLARPSWAISAETRSIHTAGLWVKTPRYIPVKIQKPASSRQRGGCFHTQCHVCFKNMHVLKKSFKKHSKNTKKKNTKTP